MKILALITNVFLTKLGESVLAEPAQHRQFQPSAAQRCSPSWDESVHILELNPGYPRTDKPSSVGYNLAESVPVAYYLSKPNQLQPSPVQSSWSQPNAAQPSWDQPSWDESVPAMSITSEPSANEPRSAEPIGAQPCRVGFSRDNIIIIIIIIQYSTV